MKAHHTLAKAASGVAICAMLWSLPAFADDPRSVKEMLGRAQSQSEQQAVEDLIRKLQPAGRSGSQPAAAPIAPTVPPRPPEVIEARPAAKDGPKVEPPGLPPPVETSAAKSAPAGGGSQTASPSVEPSAPVASSAPPATTLERAVESAEQNKLPSVDLEVYFDRNSAAITRKTEISLTPLGRALSDPRLADGAFLIAGHTDATGDADYNLRLSELRAEAVRRFLISNFGIDERRLVAKGFGQQRLKNPRSPWAAENRRVQIVNMTQAPKP